MAIYFNNIEVTNQIYRLAWLHVMESENKSKFGGGKGGVKRGDSVSLFCNKMKLKGINHHKPWLGTVDVAKEDTIFTTSTTASDGKLKNQLYSKRKDVRLRYRHTASETTRVVLQHGSIRSHKRISNSKKRRGRTVKNANAIGHHCGGKGGSGRPEPIMEGVEVVGGGTSSMEAEQKADKDENPSKLQMEKEDCGMGIADSQKEERQNVNIVREMPEQCQEDMQGTAISNNKNSNVSINNNDSTSNNQRGVEIVDKDDPTHACTTTSGESTAGVAVVNGPGDESPLTQSSLHRPITTSGGDTTTTGDAIVKLGDNTTTAIGGKFGEQANKKSMDVKINEMNFPCSDGPSSLLKLVDQKPGCSTSAMGTDQYQSTVQSSLNTPEGAIAEEEEDKLPNSMLSYPLLVDIYKGNMRAKEIDSATICQKEKEINEKLSSSTLPDICITNVVKSAQSLGKGIRECIAIYKNVKELKEQIHNRSLPEILNTENEDKINKVKHLLFEISESVALYENVRNLEKELTSPPRKEKTNRDVWKRKIPGRTRKQLNSRASSSLPSNFQESDEDGILEKGEGEVEEEESKDSNVVIVVDEEDDGEEGDIEDIADDDSSEDEKKNLLMMEKLNEKLATAVNMV